MKGNYKSFVYILIYYGIFSPASIARGLPKGCFPIEASPAVEIDEHLCTHIGSIDLPIHER